MSPWTILGWVLVALIVVPIALHLAVGVLDFAGSAVRATKRKLRRNRADAAGDA